MIPLPEILFASSDEATSKRLGRLLEKGTIRKLVPRAYTSNLVDKEETIVLGNWSLLISGLYPGAQLTHRSALEFRPSPLGNLYLTYNTRRVIRWPGLTLRIVEGPDPLEDDRPLYGDLYVSSFERACLENLTRSRVAEGEKRTLPQEVIEQRLLQELQSKGEDHLNEIRDRAREIADQLDLVGAFKKLNFIISAVLSTKPGKHLKSVAARAQAIGRPYDSDRVALFRQLIAYLQQCSFERRRMVSEDPSAFRNLAFFESYFSNYIEGTQFLIEEAEDIIFRNKEIPHRTGDTHDIKGTYAICADQKSLTDLPESEDAFITLLRARHAVIMEGRPDKNPGSFKTSANRAGDSFFVEPSFVLGTLLQGFEMMQVLIDPLARALYMMFLISEVHPFDDGNGRMARIMMNAELVAENYCKIVIPTVYRDDYLLNLRKLTRKRDPNGFLQMMDRAHAFTAWLDPTHIATIKVQLYQSNAFRESDEARLSFPISSRSIIPQIR